MTAREFALEIDAELDECFDEWRLIIRKVALQGLSGVVKKTRVDTGRARGNWFVDINEQLRSDPTDDKDKSTDGAKTVSRGSAVIDRYDTYRGFPDVIIYNNVEYILPLEFGHGTFPGDHMVTLTLTELQAQFT